MNINERIYKELEVILGDLNDLPEYVKMKSGGLMDLNMDRLYHKDRDGEIVIALAHNYEQNGDLIPDPDMEIRINPLLKMAEALTYQDTYGYQEVYPVPGMVNLRNKQMLNTFLKMWLQNLKNQGFKKQAEESLTLPL